MDPKERYLKTVKCEETDIIPRTPILMQFAAEFINSNYAKFASNYRVLVDANFACAKAFSFEQLSCISDPYRETEGFGGIIEYMENGLPNSTHPLAGSKDLKLLSQLRKPDPL